MTGSPKHAGRERLAPEGWELIDWIATAVSEGVDEILIEDDSELGEAWDNVGLEHRRILGAMVANLVRDEVGPLLADRDRWEAEAKRWRARCSVTDVDVAEAGVTWAHVDAWVLAQPDGDPSEMATDGRPLYSWRKKRDNPDGPTWQWGTGPIIHRGMSLAEAIDAASCVSDARTPWHILDEMAAMPVEAGS